MTLFFDGTFATCVILVYTVNQSNQLPTLTELVQDAMMRLVAALEHWRSLAGKEAGERERAGCPIEVNSVVGEMPKAQVLESSIERAGCPDVEQGSRPALFCCFGGENGT